MIGLPLIMVAVAVAEILLAATWCRFCYRQGIPVFKRELALPTSSSTKLDVCRLEAEVHSSLDQPVAFFEIGNAEYAFREKLEFRLGRFAPVMHGQMMIDGQHGILRVVGRLY